MHFRLYPLRFRLIAQRALQFPPGAAGNRIRGSLGAALKELSGRPEFAGAYDRLFKPQAGGSGPSGLADWPRPFVLRVAHLEGATVAAGEGFDVGVNLFDLRSEAVAALDAAFAILGRQAEPPALPVPTPVEVSLEPEASEVTKVVVRFLTPTELKGDSGKNSLPPFALLAARIRDRISTLRALYGEGPLPIDFRGFAERAALVRTVRGSLRDVDVQRRSRGTGQTHSLGGFAGEVEYEGDLAEFVPYLRAAGFTGVGRQTVWGKGEIGVDVWRTL